MGCEILVAMARQDASEPGPTRRATLVHDDRRGRTTQTGLGNWLASKERGPTSRRSEIAKTLSASARTCIAARNLIERFFNKIKQETETLAVAKSTPSKLQPTT